MEVEIIIYSSVLFDEQQLLLAASFAANCEMRKREICPTVKCETKCEFCIAL